jgi:superfamily II DNA/RNA helicase
MCKIKYLKPNYINIKVNGKKSQDKKITTNAIKYKINKKKKKNQNSLLQEREHQSTIIIYKSKICTLL